MNKFLPAALSAMLAYPLLSHARTITESMSIDEQNYDWNAVLSFPIFNTNLGKLESVSITETSDTNLTVLARNYSEFSDGIVSYYYGESTYIKPLFSDGTLFPLNNFGGNLAIIGLQQSKSLASHSGSTHTVNYGNNLARFTVPWSLSLSGSGYDFVSLYGGVSDQSQFNQGVTFSVTYDYSDVKEPDTLWIFLLGLFFVFLYQSATKDSA